MRAAIHQPGEDSLHVVEVDDPVAGAGQLLVRMRAAGLNRADLLARLAPLRPGSTSRPLIAGAEVAGEVVAVGPGTARFRVGDRVMGLGRGYAELVAVEADAALPVPDTFAWEEAGGLPVALLTMHDALRTNGGLQAGQAVCINAATSGVGVTGIQLASLFGATTVIATSRSAQKLAVLGDFLGPLDCEVVFVDSDREDVAARVVEATSGRGADVVVDNVGGSVLAINLAAAAITGRIIQVGRLGGRTDTIDLDELARKRVSLIGVTFRTRTPAEVVEVVRRCEADVADRLPACRPRIDRVFPLAEARPAQEALARNEHVGKIVLVP